MSDIQKILRLNENIPECANHKINTCQEVFKFIKGIFNRKTYEMVPFINEDLSIAVEETWNYLRILFWVWEIHA